MEIARKLKNQMYPSENLDFFNKQTLYKYKLIYELISQEYPRQI